MKYGKPACGLLLAAVVASARVGGAHSEGGSPGASEGPEVESSQRLVRLAEGRSKREEQDPQIPSLNFRDLDNQLRDCDIPFDDLQAKSPFCSATKLAEGSRCERFSYSQFPEVVSIKVYDKKDSFALCTGTLVALDWVLTGAHCFIGSDSTASITKSSQRDWVWKSDARKQAKQFKAVHVDALNAKMISSYGDRLKRADRVVVYGAYTGKSSKSAIFDGDLALIHLASPYPWQAVQPAALAKEQQFSTITTLAGVGFSNVKGGRVGWYNMTWPPKVTREAGKLQYAIPKGDTTRSGFCNGDSGGPVFVGRLRGCKTSDVVPEGRPHLLQGVISYYYPTIGKGDTTEQQGSSSCRDSDLPMVMQDITLPERHKWICGTVDNDADGCD